MYSIGIMKAAAPAEIPTPPPKLSLKISTDYKNSLDGIVLYEPFNNDLYQQLMRSDLMRDTFSCEFTGARFTDERAMLRKYYDNRVVINGETFIKVVYKKSGNNPLGRCNPVNSLGLFNIRREIRQTLVKGALVDIDIKNCHPVMLHQILKTYSIPHPCLENYIDNRENWISQLMARYPPCTKDDAKVMVIRYLYGSGFKGLKEKKRTDGTIKKGVVPDDATECKLLENLRMEVKHIHKTLARHNPDVIAITKRIKADKETANINGSACSYILQEYESRILEVIYNYCVSHKIIRDGVVALCADGCMVKPEHFYPELPDELGAEVLRLTGFDLTLIEKEMEQDYRAILGDHLTTPLTEPIPIPAFIVEICDEIRNAPVRSSAPDRIRKEAEDAVVAVIEAKRVEMEKAADELATEREAVDTDADALASLHETITATTESIQSKETEIHTLKVAHAETTAAIKSCITVAGKCDKKLTDEEQKLTEEEKEKLINERIEAHTAFIAEQKAMKKSLTEKNSANVILTLQLKEEIRVLKKDLQNNESVNTKLAKKVAKATEKITKTEEQYDALHKAYDNLKTRKESMITEDYNVRIEKYKDDIADANGDNIPVGVWSDREAAQLVLLLYPHFHYCKKVLYSFDDSLGIWGDSTQLVMSIIARFNDKLFMLKMGKDGEVEKTPKSYGSTTRMTRDLIPQLESLCCDDTWVEKSKGTGIGKILFKNGYYDYDRKQFITKFNPEVVFFGSISHKFELPTSKDTAYMNDIRTRLFHNALGKEVGDYLLLNFARALAGDSAKDLKRILFVLGETNCGKTILTMALTASCGGYVDTFNGESLAFKKMDSGDAAQSLRWAMLVSTARIIISNELTHKADLNTNLIKKITSGGDPIKGRLHGGNETTFNTHFMPILFANDMVKLTPYDSAMDKRARFIQFRKSFVEKPSNEFELQMDANIKHEIDTPEFQRCFVLMLIRAYTEFAANGKRDVEPAEVIVAKKDYVGSDGGDVVKKFLKDYEITGHKDDFVESKKVEAWIRNNDLGISMTKFGLDMNKYIAIRKIAGVKSKVKTIYGKSVQCWVGIREIPEVFNDEADKDSDDEEGEGEDILVET